MDEVRRPANCALELLVSPTPNVLKIIIALEELELPYRLRQVDVWRGEQFDEAITRLNPNAKVPILVDRSVDPVDGYPVFESGAILVYLAENSGDLLPASGPARHDVLKWLFFQVANIGPAAGQFNHYMMFAGEGQDYAVSRYATELHRLYEVMDSRLAGAPYLGGERYSIADIASFPWLRNQSRRFGGSWPFLSLETGGDSALPHLRAWYDGVAARDAVGRAVAIFDAIPSTLAAAAPSDLDRIFGRGAFAVGRHSG